MYKQKRKQKNSGITLIALVLTIIVLLILAGVVLSLALGQNGLVFKARETKQEQEIAQEKDRIMTAYGATFVHKNGKYDENRFKENLKKSGVFGDDDTLTTTSNSPLKIELVRKHEGYTVTYTIEDGIVNHKQVGDNTTTNNTIPKDLKVGDTIIYDPTKGVTDTSKLTYTSVKGTAKTGGNGYGTQTVTAKSTNNEWIVISTANNQVKVMSKKPIGDIEGGINNKFALQGGIGWLYAEEELNKACSVFGYGKGVINTTTTYQIGNKYIGEAQTRTLKGSGARSMIMEDIVKIMKGEEYSDFTDEEKKFFESDYMNPSRKSKELYYPTISSDKENGSSTDKKIHDNEYYDIHSDKNGEYDKELVLDKKVKENKKRLKNHIFQSDIYLLASRSVNSADTRVEFYIYLVNYNKIHDDELLIMVIGGYNVSSGPRYLRPIVYLDGSMLEKQSDGVWEIK